LYPGALRSGFWGQQLCDSLGLAVVGQQAVPVGGDVGSERLISGL